jgi:hypothetical protein
MPHLIEKTVEDLAVGDLFDAPPLHELADVRVLTGGCAEQLAMIHIGQRFHIAHVQQNRNELFVDGVLLDLVPLDRTDKPGVSVLGWRSYQSRTSLLVSKFIIRLAFADRCVR